MEEDVAADSSILAGRIPWTGEPGGLQSMGSQSWTRLKQLMAPHSSTLAWKIPWTEEPGGPQSMGSLRVGHDYATSLSLFTFMHWRWKWQPTPAFLPGESQGWRSLVGCRLWGHTESDTTEATWQQQQQKQLSTHAWRCTTPTFVGPSSHGRRKMFGFSFSSLNLLFVFFLLFKWHFRTLSALHSHCSVVWTTACRLLLAQLCQVFPDSILLHLLTWLSSLGVSVTLPAVPLHLIDIKLVWEQMSPYFHQAVTVPFVSLIIT